MTLGTGDDTVHRPFMRPASRPTTGGRENGEVGALDLAYTICTSVPFLRLLRPLPAFMLSMHNSLAL